MILFMDSFDTYTAANLASKYDLVGGSSSDYEITTGRTNNGLKLQQPLMKNLNSAVTTIICGIAFKILDMSSDRRILGFANRDAWDTYLTVKTNGSIQLNRSHCSTGVPVDIATGVSSQIIADTWYYLEMKLVKSGTGNGSVVIKIDGTTVLSSSSLSTFYNNVSGITSVYLPASAKQVVLDDFYILDTSGSNNNDFIGVQKISVLTPTSNGTYIGLTGNYTHVQSCDSYYASGSGSGVSSTFNLTGISGTLDNIYGVQVSVGARKVDGGKKTIQIRTRVNNVNNDSNDIPLNSNIFNYYSKIYEVNPTTNIDWSVNDINSIELGIEIQ